MLLTCNIYSITKEKEKEKNINLNININNSNYNNSDISLKNLLNNMNDKSKNSKNKDKRLYSYMNNNKELFLGNRFSQKIINLFESPIHLKKQNFPLFKKWKISNKSK